jgi:hypothetical protein
MHVSIQRAANGHRYVIGCAKMLLARLKFDLLT